MKNKKILILIVIVFISIGFAILTASLNINGQVSFKDSVWDVHFENIVVEEDSVEAEKPTITDKTEVSFNVSLSRPGDYYEFYVDVVNAGTMDATLNEINKTELIDQYAEKLNYNVTYYSDSPIQKGDLLRAGLKQRIKVRVEYKYDLDEYTKLDDLSLSLNITYQKTDIQSASYNKDVWDIDFTGTEEMLNISKSGTYKLEVWGSQGGTVSYNDKEFVGGYGGYSIGSVLLDKDQKIYINVGGAGTECNNEVKEASGGYNGGGKCTFYSSINYIEYGSGGGATHIALEQGKLSSFENKTNNILIVAAGGGGAGISNFENGTDFRAGDGGSGGGISGTANINRSKTYNSGWTSHNVSTGGNQTSGGTPISRSPSDSYVVGEAGFFGQGGGASNVNPTGACGGGGGYYGGAGNRMLGGSGGSGYIANALLKNKSMYCYNCEQSSDPNTKTITTTNASEIPTSNYAKKGNGYARITYLG